MSQTYIAILFLSFNGSYLANNLKKIIRLDLADKNIPL